MTDAHDSQEAGPAGSGGPEGAGEGAGRYDPSTMMGNVTEAPTVLVWYRRPWVLATAAVVVVLLAAVLVDLPHHTSISEDTRAETGLMNQINTDLAPCGYAVQEAFTIYTSLKDGTLTPADRVRVPALLRDDQTACSFTSQPIYDLSSMQPAGTDAGKSVGQVDSQVTTWTTSDALAAIEDIQNIYAGSGTAATTADLTKQQGLLASDRARAIEEFQTAERQLGNAHLPPVNLPVLPRLPGS